MFLDTTLQSTWCQYSTNMMMVLYNCSSRSWKQRCNRHDIPRHATISWGKSVFFQWKSVSIRILHLCIDVSWERSRDSYRDAVCKKISTLNNKTRQPATQLRTKIGSTPLKWISQWNKKNLAQACRAANTDDSLFYRHFDTAVHWISKKSGNYFLQFVSVDLTSSANTENITSFEHFL